MTAIGDMVGHLRCMMLGLVTAATIAAGLAHAETPGLDGPATITGSGTVVNTYTFLDGGVSAGDTEIRLDSSAGIGVGDLLLIYQPAGASIDTGNSAAYGTVTNYANAGRYEFVTVNRRRSGNRIVIERYGGTCGGLTYSYDGNNSGPRVTQVIRVPQYSTLTVGAGASITAPAWNGTTGGVVAVHVAGTARIDGTISVAARGFRGGGVDNSTFDGITGYRSSNAGDGGEKGEGIAGYRGDLPGGTFYGRGAPANGGGGGNGHNGGGGGGANGNSGDAWSGQGIPDTALPNWVTAWNLDPTLDATTRSSGGGRGGYTWSSSVLNPLVNGPGTWGNDRRREAGGLGGRPLAFDRSGRLFFGGGGGTGDANNGNGQPGGAGGGLVFVIAGSVTGSGTIDANGADGGSVPASGCCQDAPSGGGGGGTVVVKAGSLSGVRITADGGKGGDHRTAGDGNETEGPGGGGGGGVIAVSGGFASASAAGGLNGTSNAPSLVTFVHNGATRGASGQAGESAPSNSEIPFCFAPAPRLDHAKNVEVYDPAATGLVAVPGNDVLYTILVGNSGTRPDTNSVIVVDQLPPNISFYNGDVDDGGPATGPILFTDADGGAATGLTCCTGGEISYSDSLAAPPVFGYTPAAGYDPNVRFIRFAPSGQMADGTGTPVRFSVKFRGRIE